MGLRRWRDLNGGDRLVKAVVRNCGDLCAVLYEDSTCSAGGLVGNFK